MSQWVRLLHMLLAGKALHVWDLQLTRLDAAKEQPSCELFEAKMLRHCAVMMPLHAARFELHQSRQSGTVDDFHKGMETLQLTLLGSACAISDAEFLFQFYYGLQSDICEHVDANCSANWFQDSQSLIKLALHAEQNKKVKEHVQQQEVSHANNHNHGQKHANGAKGNGKHKNKQDKSKSGAGNLNVCAASVSKRNKKGAGNNKEPFIAKAEWALRVKADRCPRCTFSPCLKRLQHVLLASV